VLLHQHATDHRIDECDAVDALIAQDVTYCTRCDALGLHDEASCDL